MTWMGNGRPIRIAAAGDVHASPATRERVGDAFAALDPTVDLVLLAGDLTTCGDPAEAAVLAEACRGLRVPVCAVLGNHDWHLNRTHEVVAVLTDAGVRVLERSSARFDVRGQEVGVAGLKGFVGGFPDHVLPDFGEPLLRAVYAETTDDVSALDRELAAIDGCDLRIVLLHYAPTTTTLEGEPRGIWAFLGSDRLAGPIAEHAPDLVLHGHAHAGTFEGFVGRVPVYNVATYVTGKDFWIFDLTPEQRPRVERPAEARAE
ncbi:MAG TPA: metallophosphoesterase [Gaiellaceae bacterium]|jgi:Icc-related predicted phosphoesterase